MRHLIILACLLLCACQQIQVQSDFDTRRDFSAYRSWSWKTPALQYRPDDPRLRSDLTEQRVREAIAAQLDQHGLRPAQGAPDLLVQAWLILDQRQEQYTNLYAAPMIGGWGAPWGPAYGETRTLDYQVITLQIDLFDARDGKLVWRGSAEQLAETGNPPPAARAAAIRRIVAKVLEQYPPR